MIQHHKGLSTTQRQVTRGHGALELFLARQRSHQANSLIPETLRAGRVLDIGFGTYPLFLNETRFAERYGIDRNVPADLVAQPTLHLVAHDVEHKRRLPFADNFFSVVTLLAVFEHLDEPVLIDLLRETQRVLAVEGLLVLTTPAAWTAGILKSLARLGLVSGDEVGEHRDQYSGAQVRDILIKAGFGAAQIQTGSFELGMNIWARARRS